MPLSTIFQFPSPPPLHSPPLVTKYDLLLKLNFFKYILLIMLLQLSHFFLPFIPLCPELPAPSNIASLSSCPWVMHISSLASPFPTLFLTSPCLFSTYHLCFLFPVPFPPSSALSLPPDNPLCDIYFCDSVPVQVVCLVCFCCLFMFGCS